MAAQRKVVEDLLAREAHQSTAAAWGDGCAGSPSRLNAVWRRKVMQWYFTLIAALRRRHSAAAELGGGGDVNPFSRVSVHVTASLLDNYLTALPLESALRYRHDRPAYQLLATTCLLIGMRLARHDQAEGSRQRGRADGQLDRDGEAPQGRPGMKRVEAHRKDMNDAAGGGALVTGGGAAIPNAAGILRISAAPKSITEKRVLSMVREVMGSRSFPRSKVVTALDFIQAFDASGAPPGAHVGQAASLGSEELGVAFRLADASLTDVVFLGYRPSVVACAAITLSLARSRGANLDMTSLRQQVHRSVFGDEVDSALLVAVRMAESSLLVAIQAGLPSLRNDLRRIAPTIHLTPLEDE